MCTNNLCFEQKYEKNSIENYHFFSREKSLYIVWACFHNEAHRLGGQNGIYVNRKQCSFAAVVMVKEMTISRCKIVIYLHNFAHNTYCALYLKYFHSGRTSLLSNKYNLRIWFKEEEILF